jgi:hypothetical protein
MHFIKKVLPRNYDIITKDNCKRGLNSNAGARAKSDLAGAVTDFKHQSWFNLAATLLGPVTITCYHVSSSIFILSHHFKLFKPKRYTKKVK